MQGVIRKLSERGFGFISTPIGSDVFFHASKVKGKHFPAMRVGDKVEYEVEAAADGRIAATIVTMA